MLLNDLDIESRITSRDNLINRLRPVLSTVPAVIDIESSKTAEGLTDRELAVIDTVLQEAGFVEENTAPDVNDLVPNALDQIKVNLAQATALEVVQESLDLLRQRMVEVEKPERLSKIASEASKIIDNLRPPEKEDKTARGSVIIYKPVMADISNYTVVKAVE